MRRAVVPVIVAVWLGAALLFAAAVAPAAFAVLPSRALAGALVGQVLPVVLIAGIPVGVLGFVLAAGGRRVVRGALLLLAIACAVAQFAVGPRIGRLRQAIGPSLDALAADDPRRVAFGRLHVESVAWLGVAMLAAAVAVTGEMLAQTRRPR
jgi:uncharacterized protein DUF4149